MKLLYIVCLRNFFPSVKLIEKGTCGRISAQDSDMLSVNCGQSYIGSATSLPELYNAKQVVQASAVLICI